ESHDPYRYTLTIDGMMCSNCARTVENTLNAMDGVWTRVNLGRREAKVLSKVPRERQAFSDALSPTAYTVTDWRED
ncbi:MAG: heavy-metal-associated domain-containing protein, partial [Mogibacterium sp.]|nr:heavy-metal-associated domain-containing protein [Mogibacterium sp.]